MIRIHVIWRALGASDLRGRIDKRLALVGARICAGRAVSPRRRVGQPPRRSAQGARLRRAAACGYAPGACKPAASPGRARRRARSTSRKLLRQARSQPIADALHSWFISKRQALAKADVTAKAIDYSLSNWTALTRFLDDGKVPTDNNAAENSVRPVAPGRKNWLFVGSQHACERAAVVMSLIEPAKLNGHDPWTYLKDVFERLPTLKHRNLAQLLPHHWRPATGVGVTSPIAALTTAPEPLAA